MFRVCKLDAKKQIVTGEVFAPNVLDSHGEMMLPEDVEKLAHRFMQLASIGKTIDYIHNQASVNAYPIESFVATEAMTDYTPGAWVLSVKIDDANLWAEVEAGKLNGFSFQAMVYKVPAVVEVQVDVETIGETEENDGHTHFFFAELDGDGKVQKGRTSTANNHSHEIKAGTATEETNGHSHRFFI